MPYAQDSIRIVPPSHEDGLVDRHRFRRADAAIVGAERHVSSFVAERLLQPLAQDHRGSMRTGCGRPVDDVWLADDWRAPRI